MTTGRIPVVLSSYPDAQTVTEAAFNRWITHLSRDEGKYVLIFRDYLYTAWLAGQAYADSQR